MPTAVRALAMSVGADREDRHDCSSCGVLLRTEPVMPLAQAQSGQRRSLLLRRAKRPVPDAARTTAPLPALRRPARHLLRSTLLHQLDSLCFTGCAPARLLVDASW
jgi:hypothetical protein